jgi:hypothetical protein
MVRGTAVFSIRQILRLLGLSVTVALAALAFMPTYFQVPVDWRGWIFLAFIGWLFAFCAGFFDA